MILKNKKWKRISKYVGLGVIFYFIFLVITFPTELIQDRMLESISKAIGSKLNAKKVSLSLFSGVKLDDLEVKIGDSPLRLQRLSVRPSLLSLIFGKQAASFSARAKGIDLNGSLSRAKENIDLELDIDSLELKELLPLLGENDLKLKGIVAGEIELNGPEKEISRGNLSNASGLISLKSNKPSILASKYKLPRSSAFGPFSGTPINIPKTDFKKLNLRGKLEKKVLKISRLNLDGEQLSANVNGKVKVAKIFNFSQVDFKIDLTLGQKINKQLETFKPMLPKGISYSGNKASFNLGGSMRNPFIKQK